MNTADMLVHIHPELDAKRRTQIEKMIEGHVGVDCAGFNRHPHPHALIVKYDPDTIRSVQILDMVRKFDPVASIVGL